MNIILIIAVVVIVLVIIFDKTRSDNNIFDMDKKLPYRRKDYLLTVAERKFYDVLIRVVEENNWVLFSKVRLEDLLWIPANTENRFGLRNRIKSRHIDFVICDKENIRPLIAIELDDSSHKREDRIDRDEKVGHILKDAGLPLLHVIGTGFYDRKLLVDQIRSSM
jgi:hypothetical protein